MTLEKNDDADDDGLLSTLKCYDDYSIPRKTSSSHNPLQTNRNTPLPLETPSKSPPGVEKFVTRCSETWRKTENPSNLFSHGVQHEQNPNTTLLGLESRNNVSCTVLKGVDHGNGGSALAASLDTNVLDSLIDNDSLEFAMQDISGDIGANATTSVDNGMIAHHPFEHPGCPDVPFSQTPPVAIENCTQDNLDVSPVRAMNYATTNQMTRRDKSQIPKSTYGRDIDKDEDVSIWGSPIAQSPSNNAAMECEPVGNGQEQQQYPVPAYRNDGSSATIRASKMKVSEIRGETTPFHDPKLARVCQKRIKSEVCDIPVKTDSQKKPFQDLYIRAAKVGDLAKGKRQEKPFPDLNIRAANPGGSAKTEPQKELFPCLKIRAVRENVTVEAEPQKKPFHILDTRAAKGVGMPGKLYSPTKPQSTTNVLMQHDDTETASRLDADLDAMLAEDVKSPPVARQKKSRLKLSPTRRSPRLRSKPAPLKRVTDVNDVAFNPTISIGKKTIPRIRKVPKRSRVLRTIEEESDTEYGSPSEVSHGKEEILPWKDRLLKKRKDDREQNKTCERVEIFPKVQSLADESLSDEEVSAKDNDMLHASGFDDDDSDFQDSPKKKRRTVATKKKSPKKRTTRNRGSGQGNYVRRSTRSTRQKPQNNYEEEGDDEEGDDEDAEQDCDYQVQSRQPASQSQSEPEPCEMGSITIKKVTKKVRRKKKQNEELLKYWQRRLKERETDIMHKTFIQVYPQPPSNMAFAGQRELKTGRMMSQEESKQMWEEELKPWSDRWWKLYDEFADRVQDHKLTLPLEKCNITLKIARKLAKDFRIENGPANPKETDEDEQPKPRKRRKKNI